MSNQIVRVTMIKIPFAEHQAIALQGFSTFTKTQEKNGHPYILSLSAGYAKGHVLDQGYTIVTKSVFANAQDMDYYMTECPAHKAYKEFLAKNAPVEGLMSVFFTPEVGGGRDVMM
ncbi:hypothetical protein EG328_011467 [Venturia inaequalis]|uniref:Stress-response A/B barrel domain-containing protein n=2 Tax=Venturia inaequalis TaxID=5025 RepID=A0A8H3V6N7_VENIN|nr:hypothetical protein EG328_011467 [Venturia inaequalis]